MKFIFGLLIVLFGAAIQAEQESLFGLGQIKLGQHYLSVEIASTEKARQQGLMERQNLDVNHGMLFVFSDEQIRHFWMKNTYIPLTIGFFDKSKKLVDIQDMKPVNSPMDLEVHRYQSKKPAKYALEVNKGWYAKNEVKLGDTLFILKSSTGKK